MPFGSAYSVCRIRFVLFYAINSALKRFEFVKRVVVGRQNQTVPRCFNRSGLNGLTQIELDIIFFVAVFSVKTVNRFFDIRNRYKFSVNKSLVIFSECDCFLKEIQYAVTSSLLVLGIYSAVFRIDFQPRLARRKSCVFAVAPLKRTP